VRNQRSKWRPRATANHDSDRSCACEQIEGMGSEPQFQRDRRGRIPPNGSTKSRTRKRTAETPEKPQQKKHPKCRADAAAPNNRRIRRGARRECDEERENKNTENPRERQRWWQCAVGGAPSIGDLKWGGHQQTESLEQRAPMAARALARSPRSRRQPQQATVPSAPPPPLARLPPTGRTRIE